MASTKDGHQQGSVLNHPTIDGRVIYFESTLQSQLSQCHHIYVRVLTQAALTIPIQNGRLALGACKGIFLYEHRLMGYAQKTLVTC